MSFCSVGENAPKNSPRSSHEIDKTGPRASIDPQYEAAVGRESRGFATHFRPMGIALSRNLRDVGKEGYLCTAGSFSSRAGFPFHTPRPRRAKPWPSLCLLGTSNPPVAPPPPFPKTVDRTLQMQSHPLVRFTALVTWLK